MRTDCFLAVAILGGGVKSLVMEPMASGGPLDRNWDFCVFTDACPKRLSIYYHLDWPARELSSPPVLRVQRAGRSRGPEDPHPPPLLS